MPPAMTQTKPARMILYNGHTDFEEAKQQLISYSWEEKLPFIHFPKVEALSPETTIRALALAGGSEVAKSLGLEVKPQEKSPALTTAASLGFVSGEDIADKTPVPEQEPEPELEPEPEPEADQPLAEEPKISPLQLIKQKAGGGLAKLTPAIKNLFGFSEFF